MLEGGAVVGVEGVGVAGGGGEGCVDVVGSEGVGVVVVGGVVEADFGEVGVDEGLGDLVDGEVGGLGDLLGGGAAVVWVGLVEEGLDGVDAGAVGAGEGVLGA